MKSDELLTPAEIRQQLSAAAADLRAQADADAKSLLEQQTDMSSDLGAQVHADLVAQVPGIADALPADRYTGLAAGALDTGATAYERTFQDARSRLLASTAQSVDGYLALVLQSAVDAIDGMREVTDELAVEAAQFTAAAATGLLLPVTTGDLDDLGDELHIAQDQAHVVVRELDNLDARRQAAAQARDQALARSDDFPLVRQIPGRVLVRTPAANETDQRSDQGLSLAQGTPGQPRATVARDQAARLQELMRLPAEARIGYIVICGVLGNLARSKLARDKAGKQIAKIKAIFAAITQILSGSFLTDLQGGLEAGAKRSAATALAFIQAKLDAVGGFLAARVNRQATFVSTVQAIGDVPTTAPLADSIASLCSLKGARFCDLNGLLEVAKSLDSQFALQASVPPMVGRAVLSLDAADVPAPVVAPGQEASLLLVSMTGSHVRAMFTRDDAPSSLDPVDHVFRERAGVFGQGPGTLTILGSGEQADIGLAYVDVAFDVDSGDYTFGLDQTAVDIRDCAVRAESDPTIISGADWDSSTTFAVGGTSITLRVTRASDISVPCDLVMGYGEQTVVAGVYDASVAGVVRALAPAFETWMTGLLIDLGPATAGGVAESRTIATVIDEQTLTYSGANVAATLPGASGSFRVTGDRYETLRALAMTAVSGTGELQEFTLATPLARPHGRQVAIPQRQVHVSPAARDEFLSSSSSPADSSVRDETFLPAGSTSLSATYVNQAAAAIFTPQIMSAGSGQLFIAGQGPLAWTAVADLGAGQLGFTLAAPTSAVFAAGASVEVETTSLAARFPVVFASDWSQPLDAWLLALGVELNKLEARLCRLLSGSSQDLAASALALAALAQGLSATLTAARFLLVSWLVPLAQAPAVARAVRDLDGIGATRATRAAREGRVGDLVAMAPAEGSDDGAMLIAAQGYQQRLTTEEQYRLLSKSVAELQGRVESLAAAANAVSDIRSAQEREIERRREGARRLQALQEVLP